MGTHRHIPVIISVTKSCEFGVVRVMFVIPKRVSSLCFRSLLEMFLLLLAVMHEKLDRISSNEICRSLASPR